MVVERRGAARRLPARRTSAPRAWRPIDRRKDVSVSRLMRPSSPQAMLRYADTGQMPGEAGEATLNREATIRVDGAGEYGIDGLPGKLLAESSSNVVLMSIGTPCGHRSTAMDVKGCGAAENCTETLVAGTAPRTFGASAGNACDASGHVSLTHESSTSSTCSPKA